jgi:hypothetical protein
VMLPRLSEWRKNCNDLVWQIPKGEGQIKALEDPNLETISSEFRTLQKNNSEQANEHSQRQEK